MVYTLLNRDYHSAWLPLQGATRQSCWLALHSATPLVVLRGERFGPLVVS